MQIRNWGNGLAIAGLLIAIGGTLVQSPQIFGLSSNDVSWVRIIFFASLVIAVIAIILLRPTKDIKNIQRLKDLRNRLSDRDVAFLKIASTRITWPTSVSAEACYLAPPGETWNKESDSEAEDRAKKLIAMGLLQRRGSEVETTDDGKALVNYDEIVKFSNKTEE